MTLAFVLAGLLLAILGVLPWFSGDLFLVDLFANFPLQGALLSLVLFGAALIWRRASARRWLALLFFGAGLLNGIWVWPLLHSESQALASPNGEREHIRVIAANVEGRLVDPQLALDWLRQQPSDVVVLMEIDARWRAALRQLQDKFPYRRESNRLDGLGTIVLSRHPILDEARETYGAIGFPLIQLGLGWPAQRIQIIASKPPPPVLPSLFDERQVTLRGLAKWSAIEADTPTIVLGDLNLTPYSGGFRRLLAEGRLVQARAGLGVFGSWPRSLPWPLRIPIDHVLHNHHWRTVSFELGPDIGSDHLPVVAELALRPR